MGNTSEDKKDEISAAGVEPAVSTAKSNGAFQISREPVVESETDGDVHKYDIAPAPAATSVVDQPAYEDLGHLPSSYQEETLFLVARDPRWLFSYWDFNWWNYPGSSMRHGLPQFFLKISTAAGQEESIIEIKPEARNWYVPVNHPDTDYVAEIGYYTRSNDWQKIVQSSAAHTPPDTLAPEAGEGVSFATVPAHLTFDRLMELIQERMSEGETLIAALARITGEGAIQFRRGASPTWTDEQKRLLAALLGDSLIERIGLGSAEIDQLIRKQLQEKLFSESASGLSVGLFETLGSSSQSLFSAFGAFSSGLGASWSAQPFSVRAERGFFMHINAEIIFYGGTHPDATVTVNGQKIQLSPEGMFRYHFTLPDGDFEIPVVATSPDNVEQRSATLSFKRGTSRVGDVGATQQPAELDPLIGKK